MKTSIGQIVEKMPGKVYLVLSILILSSSNPIVKKLSDLGAMIAGVGGGNPISLCNVLFVGNLCALLVLLAVYHREWKFSVVRDLTKSDWWWLSLLAMLSVAIAPSFIYTALNYTSVTNVILISCLEPPLVMFLSRFILGDSPNRWQMTGASIAFVGVVSTIFLPGTASSASLSIGKGELLAIIGTAAFICSTFISKRLTNVPLGIFTVFRMLVGTILFFILAVYLFGFHHFADAFSPLLWKWMLLYGIIIVALGQLCWFQGLRRSGASDISLISSFYPVAGIMSAFLILGEIPSFAQYIGGGIILAGIFVGQYGSRVQRPIELSPDEQVKQSVDKNGFKGI